MAPKPDTLSRQFSVGEENLNSPETILPTPRLVATLTWEIKEWVKAGGSAQFLPQDRLFVPQDLRSHMLQWVHGSWLMSHPGIHHTIEFL